VNSRAEKRIPSKGTGRRSDRDDLIKASVGIKTDEKGNR